MDILTNLTNVDELDITARLALAIQGTLIIFFFVSPIMGAMVMRLFQKRADGLLAFSIAMLIVCAANFGIALLIQSLLPPDRLPLWAIQALSLLASGALAGLVMRYLRWYMRPPQDIWTLELENRAEEDLSIFDIRRKEWLERKKRAQHR